MIRAFREHEKRRVVDLEGFWDFAWLGDVDVDAVDARRIEFDDRVAVPGCFDAMPRHAGRRGLVAYRRTLGVGAGHHRLVLSGVQHWCRILADGAPLAEHAGGHTVFAVDLGRRAAGALELVVLVDNRFDWARSPLHHDYFDWYHYGGIARGAELHTLPDPWIEGVEAATTDVAAREIELTVRWRADAVRRERLVVEADGRIVIDEELGLVPPEGCLTRCVRLSGHEPWSPERPHLVTLAAELGDDDLVERVGLREVVVEGRDLLLNGVPLRLLGFNRHDAHPDYGAGLPAAALLRDVELLEDTGSNFVRGSHYPQDPRFLDLCDERGILVWSEAVGWQHGPAHLCDERFVQAQLGSIREMVASARNHPSVILWGLLNESSSHDASCRPAYDRLIREIRGLDPTRPVTYASNHWRDDLCFDLVDVVSVNAYPGWYVGELADVPAEIERIVERLAQPDAASKPAIFSEIGAGAVPGWRDQNRTRWSEEYQAALLEAVIRRLFEREQRFMGLAIWQFSDCRSSELASRILGRPRGFNNKGVVDEYRKPKLAYDVVRRLYREYGRRR